MGLGVPFGAVGFNGDPFHSFPRFAVHNRHGQILVLLVGNEAKARDLELDHHDFIIALDAFLGGGGQVIEATFQSGKCNQGAVAAIVGFGG